MNKLILLFLFWMIETAGFSQSLPFPNQGAILQRTNLDVRWKAPKHPWPKTLWTYQMVPTKFPPTLVSNLMSLADFTEKDRWGSISTNGVAYYNVKNRLMVSDAEGEIDFERELGKYGPTNLAEDVPGTNRLFQLATNFLLKLGINYSEIPKTKKGQLQINCSEPSHTEYFVDDRIITNVAFRCASFGRLIDGVECDSIVGSCTLYFGEHSQIRGIRLFWRNVERDKLYSAATPDQIVRWIREGKAVLPQEFYVGMGNTMPIDWSSVKKVTIKKATAYYWGEFFLGEREHRPILPSPVVPCAALQATVDTGATNIDVRIICPVIDETKS